MNFPYFRKSIISKTKIEPMKKLKIHADQINCPRCGTIIPKGQSKCPNPNCPSNKPLHDKHLVEIKDTLQLIE